MTREERQKLLDKIMQKSPSELADAWKRNFYKELDEEALIHFDLLIKGYKELTGKTLDPHPLSAKKKRK